MNPGPEGRARPPIRYRMPAEWERHEATWLAWPHHVSDWPGKFPAVPWVYAEIVRNLAHDEDAEVLVQDLRHERSARTTLARSGVELERVRFHVCPTDRSWTRDSGPTFVRANRPGRDLPAESALIHWKFNAWAKYDDWQRDRRLPVWMARHLGLPVERARLGDRWVVLEGGAIDVNGEGLLMATEECLLGEPQARNPGLDRDAVAAVLREYLGAEEVVWLRRGIVGDDTHGHIDDVARFVAPRTVLVVVTEDEEDPDFAALREAKEALESFRPRAGGRLEVRALPAPRPVQFRGQRLPASYANFYIANRTVLVPTFDDPHDAEALDVLRRSFPGREVVGVHARDLVWGLGTIHCLTQQQPAI
jgi:agmatine deiminase